MLAPHRLALPRLVHRHVPLLGGTQARAWALGASRCLCAANPPRAKGKLVAPAEFKVAIKAFYIAQAIDHKRVVLEFDNPSRVLNKSSLVSLGSGEGRVVDHRHMCVLAYGAVVFFNCEERLMQELLVKVAKCSSMTIPVPHSETYNLVLRSSLDKWFSVGPDQVILKSFSVDTIRTITDVLGQTVALQYFERQVESMLLNFARLNGDVVIRGEKYFQQSSTDMYKMIATTNKVLTDVLLTLNVLDRPETAWRYSAQSDLWDALRHEFDIVERFKALEFKLNVVSQNCQFFLNVLHSMKSSRLEQVIIALIAFEVVLGMYGLVVGRAHA